MSDVVRMRDVVIVGGGCYGTFYAGQLARAKEKGRAEFRAVIVVDRDPDCRARAELGPSPERRFVTAEWGAYFDGFLGDAVRAPAPGPGDFIVPSPHMPHLMFEWLLRRARARWPGRTVEVAPVPGVSGTPYDRAAADHTRYVSFADWICPTHCVEPATCPAIGRARDWEMPASVTALVDGLRGAGREVFGPALFVTRHQAYGVGAFPVDQVLAGDAVVAAAGSGGGPAAILVGTVSSCHGALNLLRLGPREPEAVLSLDGDPRRPHGER